MREWSHGQFSDYIDAVMRAKGIRNDSDLAARAGFNQTQISNWRRGKARPSPKLLDQLADALGVPARNLYSLAGYSGTEEVGEADLAVVPAEIQELVDLFNDPDLTEGERASLLMQARMAARGLRALVEERRSSEAAPSGQRRRAG